MRVKPKRETTTENTGPEQQPHHPATAKNKQKPKWETPGEQISFGGKRKSFTT